MADNRNFAALDWLIHEISETLQEAQQALEAYVENSEEVVKLRSCLTYIHQVHGSLQMMEFFGAAMLADEMERLTYAMIQGAVSNVGEAQEVLMRGILQFPNYLEQVKFSRNDNPLVILPLLNDLRAVRGESLLTDTKLFVPNLAPAKKIIGTRSAAALDNVQFQSMALKLRQMFQYAAAGFIRAVSAEENLSYLQKVFVRLHKLTQGTARQPLWDICLALAEALETDVLEMSASVKNLLRQLDKEIKILAVYGVKSLDTYTNDELIKNLLYYVARAGKNTLYFKEDSQLQRIYEAYHLADALIEGHSSGNDQSSLLSAPDTEAMRSVIEALKTELEMVKLALDECITDEYAQQRLVEVVPVIKRIADTMAVLGLGPLRKRVLEQGVALEQMANATSALSHDELMAAASNIIALENDLEWLTQTQAQQPNNKPQQREAEIPNENDVTLARAKESVLRESRHGLERAKNAIVEYIASQWDRKHLQDVPATLREIRGGLGIIPLPDAARIIDACASYIEEQLLAQEFTPQWSKLDSLADAIASVEYYLERLGGGASQEENEILLTVAEESVALLGYGVVTLHHTAGADEIFARPNVNTQRYRSDEADEQPTADIVEAEEAHLAAAYQSALQVESIEDVSAMVAISEAAAKARAQTADEIADAMAAQDDDSFTDNNDMVIEPISEIEDASLAAVAEEEKSLIVNHADDDDAIDDEIIEIFVEEAGEVLEAIGEYFPRWAQDFDDTKSLTEFRRAFHTLKGSGRMVGATDLGKLGWAIENMLNRVLDHTIMPSQVHVTMIEKVREILPAMIEAFGKHQENPHLSLIDSYCEMADSLAHGVVPEELSTLQKFIKEDKGGKDLRYQRAETLADVQNTPVASTSLPQDIYATQDDSVSQDDGVDDEEEQLWDIFAGEALTHLQVVEEFIAHMEAEAPCYEVLSDDVQRALHTLKGSAYMAAITHIAELVAPLEKFAKDLRSYQVVVTDDILQLLRDAVLYTHAGLHQIGEREIVNIPELQQFVARVNDLHNIHVEPLATQHAMDETAPSTVDPKILSIFMTEELNLLLDADVVIDQWQQNPSNVDTLQPLLNEVRQLTRGARLAGLPMLEALSDTMEHLYVHIVAQHLPCSNSLCDTLNKSHVALLDMMDTIAAGQNLSSAPAEIQTALTEWITQADANSTFIKETSVVESENKSEDESKNDSEHIDADVENISASVQEYLSHDLVLEHDEADNLSVEHESKEAFISESVEAEELNIVDEITLDEESLVDDVAVDAVDVNVEIASAPSSDHEESIVESSELEAVDVDINVEGSASEAEPKHTHFLSTSHDDDEDFDPEIIEIFIEEALELLEDIERALHNWQEDLSDPQPAEELKRYLHTFKGGARLAGLPILGDISHDFESVLIEMEHHTDINQALFAKFNDFQDRLQQGVEVTRAQLSADYVAEESAQNKQRSEQSKPSKQNEKVSASQTVTPQKTLSAPMPALVDNNYNAPLDFNMIGNKPNVLTFAPRTKPAAAPLPQIPGNEFGGLRQAHGGSTQSQHLAARRTGPQEVIKVPAQLLEELVNLAGETSISRGRMQQQVMDMSGAIGEMDSTIQRLQEQLRRLDIETEAQVAFRQEKMAQHEDFDPLEMDRYSQLQQLSRSLMESASDLMDLKYTLADKTRDAETLLLQQSRINTDLQEGLMRSRMVPFSRLVPRLRRIVRQAAVELGKEVNFELDNVEGELDRSVLERMVAPLEHMLRNAVDHGIESADERAAAGKPAMGRITLSLSREGGDVMLRLSDDGHGINLQRVREKAIERGLISEEANLSDQDLMQFILHAGFSTADKVTQISGRGVGMDVVHSEIKQLGGAMFIDSRSGEGTEFIIRLPFTVSVNRALMVQIGDDLYAIPLNTIEGIVRVSPFELEHYYQDKTARFDYAGENYLVRYLGAMLESGVNPKLEGQILPLPVVLVRSAEVTVALQVDRLLGSREIVVKTLGAQFSAVQGVSGATVMGDGSVVVILDVLALIREQLALGIGQSVLLEPYKFQPMVEEESIDKTIMVVDDSVTVRKVTTRFLEREGYRVITAKDGVEALQLLQDRLPDVMLLDIEMPRMDGFEVAKNMRTSSRLKDVPIIMITSRTGDKHRQRALDLGVNKYMGKPYQEDLLLANIQELMKKPMR